MVRLGSLFSGIGGLDLGVEHATGAHTVWQVEADAWCRSVLARHWPDARRYDDICTVGDELESVDIIAGGFPCQDVSVAGKRAGLANGERSGLWREFARIIRMVRPRFVFVENVAGLLSLDFGCVLGDLAALGFNAEWTVLRASDAGAPHRRERVFVLAVGDAAVRHGTISGLPFRPRAVQPRGAGGCVGGLADAGSERSQGIVCAGAAQGSVDGRGAGSRRAQPRLGGGADGIPRGLDAHRWPAGRGEVQHPWEPPRVAQGIRERRQRLKALGNAVVPQQAALAWRVLAERFER